jgi:DNA modification methylase
VSAPVTVGGCTLHMGDCREVLPTLPAETVHCCVTSPPYWGLRDYGCAGQIGLEASVAEYVAELVGVFREVRRVLRDDGTVFLNLGDAYFGSSQTGGTDSIEGSAKRAGRMFSRRVASQRATNRSMSGTSSSGLAYPNYTTAILKPKDLIGLPWRVAFALQADGWWLRSDIVWAKPNPMPESVTDRSTRSHEYVFMLAKSATYYFDADAVREPYQPDSVARVARGRSDAHKYADGGPGNQTLARDIGKACSSPIGRNVRSVWTIATQPCSEAHFAVMPAALAERCVKAGTSERGCCSECGAPWVRVVENGALVSSDGRTGSCGVYDQAGKGTNVPRTKADLGTEASYYALARRERRDAGWRPSCSCDAGDPVPCAVLDPFAGAATTLMVADRLQRRSVGIELSPTYCAMAAERLRRDAPLFAGASA